MADPNDERRYSDEEFALILRTASEVTAGPDPAPAREGLTLSEIQEIAADVGIDPGRVSKAAVLLPAHGDAATLRLLGGPPRLRLEHTVPGVVPPERLGRIIDVVRRALDTQGETREVFGALEWKGSTAVTAAAVSVTPREGETVLQASVNRIEGMMGTLMGIGMGGAFVFSLLGVALLGESGVGIAAGVLTGMSGGFLFARTLWKRSTRKWRGRLLQLMDAMAREAEVAVGPSGEEPAPDSL
jgi:hypothetical protein